MGNAKLESQYMYYTGPRISIAPEQELLRIVTKPLPTFQGDLKMLAKYWKWPIWWCYFNNGFKSWNKFVSLSSQLELHRLNTGRQVRVVAANRLVKQMLFRWGMILISVWHRSCTNRCLVAVKKRFAWFACPVLSTVSTVQVPQWTFTHNATQWHWNL